MDFGPWFTLTESNEVKTPNVIYLVVETTPVTRMKQELKRDVPGRNSNRNKNIWNKF
jgi:hypothetical protein